MADKSPRHVRAGKANFLQNGRVVCECCGGRGYHGSEEWGDKARAGGNASVEAANHGKMPMSERARCRVEKEPITIRYINALEGYTAPARLVL